MSARNVRKANALRDDSIIVIANIKNIKKEERSRGDHCSRSMCGSSRHRPQKTVIQATRIAVHNALLLAGNARRKGSG